jgi:cell division protein FtsZ
VDFADVRTIMTDAGSALMGIGVGKGENRAVAAAKSAVSSPLLEISIEGAKGILFNIVGGPDMSMLEVDEAAKIISQAADADANIIFGATIDESMKEQMKITVVATGFDEDRKKLSHMMTSRLNRPQPVYQTYGASHVSSVPAQPQAYGIGIQTQVAHTEPNSQPVSPQSSGTGIRDHQLPTQNQQNYGHKSVGEEDDDELDIPTFLRAQK